MNCGISQPGHKKLIKCILKFYFNRRKEVKERKLCTGARETSLDLLSGYLLVMVFRFDAMLFSLIWVAKILMRAILRFPAPGLSC